MHADLAPYARGVKGQVTIFANSTAVSYYLPDELAIFLKARPTVRVHLEERVSHEIVVAVAERRADIGLVTWDDDHPELAFHDYEQDELMVVMPADMRLGDRHGVRLVDCLTQPFVSLQSGTAIHTFLTSRASALSQHMDVRIQVASYPAVVSLVRAGAGIAILPSWAVLSSPSSGIRTAKLLESWATRRLRVCWRKEESLLSEHARALVRQLCGEIQA
jgi:DNA-binding transcriptional LysR family regulator